MDVRALDILVVLNQAVARPEAQAVFLGRYTLAEMGKIAIDRLERGSTRNAWAALRDAAQVEEEEQVGSAEKGVSFKAAFELLLRFIDQVVAEGPCRECGALKGRPCTVKSARGGDVDRAWVHDGRAVPALFAEVSV